MKPERESPLFLVAKWHFGKEGTACILSFDILNLIMDFPGITPSANLSATLQLFFIPLIRLVDRIWQCSLAE